ncbi:MAG: protein phosphatase 2C domain-containing protein [Ktedonobacteraceae bacterium]
MLHLSGETHQRIIENDQKTDGFISTSIDNQVAVRLCSVRCQEAQIDAAPNQDYARVVFAAHNSVLSFCVCDGVGGSYQGNFAAKYLATRLTDYLLTLPSIPRTSRKVAFDLRKQLEIWASEAQQELGLVGFPQNLPALEQEILAEQRDRHGSATVFFCGRVDYAASASVHALQDVPALFCWMGNVSARVFSTSNTCEQLGDLHNDRNRWSTLSGQQGFLTIRVSALSRSEPLVIYTDGLEMLGHQLAQFDDQQLQQRIWQLLSMPGSDDMTVLEFHWGDLRR